MVKRLLGWRVVCQRSWWGLWWLSQQAGRGLASCMSGSGWRCLKLRSSAAPVLRGRASSAVISVAISGPGRAGTFPALTRLGCRWCRTACGWSGRGVRALPTRSGRGCGFRRRRARGAVGGPAFCVVGDQLVQLLAHLADAYRRRRVPRSALDRSSPVLPAPPLLQSECGVGLSARLAAGKTAADGRAGRRSTAPLSPVRFGGRRPRRRSAAFRRGGGFDTVQPLSPSRQRIVFHRAAQRLCAQHLDLHRNRTHVRIIALS